MLPNLENSAVSTGLEKVTFHSNVKEEQCQRMFKLPHNCAHFSKITLMLVSLYAKSLKLGFSSMWTENFQIQAGFRKGGETRDQIVNIHWIIEKARQFQKNIYFCLTITPKPLTEWITTNCGKFWKRWEYQTTWPASWEICMQVRKQQKWTWNNRLVPNQERSTSRLYIVTLLI